MALKILLLSAEVAPFAKTGGLADVAGALPKALAAAGHDVRVAMPAYASIERMGDAGTLTALPGGIVVPTAGGLLPAGVFATALPGSRAPVYLIAERHRFDRPQIYGYDDEVALGDEVDGNAAAGKRGR